MYLVIATALLIGIFLGGSYLIAILTGTMSSRLLRSRQFRTVVRKNFDDSYAMRAALRRIEVDALD